MKNFIDQIDEELLNKEIPEFDIGDTVRVSMKIIEGDKERTQTFEGTVIARKGRGIAETFSLHRVSYGEGMERVFNLHSPRIRITVLRKGKTRRAKLYYLRGTSGKSAKIEEDIGALRSKKKNNTTNKEEAGLVSVVQQSV